ncbi:MAG: hypothetical protein KGL39_39615 [Patescibacteria group bacterium]|nr:hypothetical protein [Patescibacteria group bacterium]
MPKYEVGRYEVEVSGQGFQKASTGNMQFVLQFKVLGKVDPNDPNTLLSVMPGERKYYKAITENTIEWLLEDLKALGVEGLTSWSQLDPNVEGSIDLTGRKVDMLCGSKNGNDGKSYEDWSIAREGGAGKPIEHAASSDVKALDRLFGKHLKKNGPAPAPARRSAPAPAPQPVAAGTITDDDLPF